MNSEFFLALDEIEKEKGIPKDYMLDRINQALLAARAGATFVSPFMGRVDDVGNQGLDLIDDIVTIFQNFGIETEIIAASIRHPMHVVEAAKLGCDIATVPYKVLKQMFNHPLTDIGIQKFLKDWETVPKK